MSRRRSPLRTSLKRRAKAERTRGQLDGGILFHLVRLGNATSVRELLLSAGDDKGQISGGFDDVGNTSLHVAAKAGNVSVLRVLLSFGASANVVNTLGETPLLLSWASWEVIPPTSLLRPAAICTVESVVELLLQYGADPNMVSLENGEGPLHLAARYGHQKLVKRLLKFRANPDKKSLGKDGVTPNILAEKGDSSEHQECVRIMGRYQPEIEEFDPEQLARKRMEPRHTAVAWRGAGSSFGRRTGTGGSPTQNMGALLKRQQQQLSFSSETATRKRGGPNRFNPRKRLGALRRPKSPVALEDKGGGGSGNGNGSHKVGDSEMTFSLQQTVHHVPIIVERFGFDRNMLDGLSSEWSPPTTYHPATR